MRIYYVFQNKTYNSELSGGYLWSPQLNKAGKKDIGYTTMTFVKKGDFILHSYKQKIVAISIAESNCYSSPKPNELSSTNWNTEGYRIDTNYFEMDTPLIVSNFKDWLIEHHKNDGPFNKRGNGKQQYISSIDNAQAVFLLREALKLPNNQQTKQVLLDALCDIGNEQQPEYDQVNKHEIIDSIIENLPNIRNEKQALKTISSEKVVPKRSLKIAAYALDRAKYLCEYNPNDRTFKRKNGKPYTEPHHLIPISKYKDFDHSVDVMENIVSLCSHCHNLLHYGRYEDKKTILKKLFQERKEALESVGLALSFEQLLNYYK